jgi:CDP-glucose 4,6-dehydratase
MLETYNNKKVLITGHTGFKGSWLTIWLLNLGAKVVGYALDPKTNRDNFVLAGLDKKIKEYREDIRNKDKVIKVVQEEKPDIIFHLAAQPLVLESYKDPIYTIETNTIGTSNILEAFRLSNRTKVLIVVTTDKVYENKEWDWGYREIDRLGGNDIYSASKSAAEIIVNAYRKSFLENSGKLLAVVRAGNVIGGGDWSMYRIVPDCIKAIEKNSEIKIRNPKSIRPWQHVLEPLGGYLLLGEKLLKGNKIFADAWNFGPISSNCIEVQALVNLIIKYFKKGRYKIIKSKNKNSEAKILKLDISKVNNYLKWYPVLNINEIVELTVEWYKKYSDSDVYQMCINQINRYMELWRSKIKN